MEREIALQVGALPWRLGRHGLEILLITSRETQRWVIPKGWPMPGLTDAQAAAREAFEEAGIDGVSPESVIGRYRYEKRMKKGGSRLCEVSVFALEVGREHARWPEARQRKRKWFAAAEAAGLVDEVELRGIIATFALRKVS